MYGLGITLAKKWSAFIFAHFFFWKSVGDDDDVPVFSDGGSGRGID